MQHVGSIGAEQRLQDHENRRTTLVKRLEKIRGVVNQDDPNRVLYLRICLNLPDIEQALEDNSDVS